MTPLEMARNCVANIEQYAHVQEENPLASHVHRIGERGHQAAQMAACLAIVSIAEDIHRIAGGGVPSPRRAADGETR
ncbi:MAG: hypothetical protein FWE15_04740 [Actinomycetia bacterium]|nr:hypothetical protein [Actinomycetes bacterium]